MYIHTCEEYSSRVVPFYYQPGPQFCRGSDLLRSLHRLLYGRGIIGAGGSAMSADAERQAMVRKQLAGRGISDERVLAVMALVPRHLFLPEELRKQAYHDRALPIAEGQTISQP